jgi:hypothetical protein
MFIGLGRGPPAGAGRPGPPRPAGGRGIAPACPPRAAPPPPAASPPASARSEPARGAGPCGGAGFAAPMPVAVELKGLFPGRGPGRPPGRGAPGRGAPGRGEPGRAAPGRGAAGRASASPRGPPGCAAAGRWGRAGPSARPGAPPPDADPFASGPDGSDGTASPAWSGGAGTGDGAWPPSAGAGFAGAAAGPEDGADAAESADSAGPASAGDVEGAAFAAPPASFTVAALAAAASSMDRWAVEDAGAGDAGDAALGRPAACPSPPAAAVCCLPSRGRAACSAVKASVSLRTTGASIVDDAERTNSPISRSLAITALLSTPNSFASS